MTTEYNKFLYVPGTFNDDIDPVVWKNFIRTTDLPDWYTYSELKAVLENHNIILTVNNDIAFKDKNEYLMFVLKYS